ncbi:MAG: dockerin type I repeat-containing protein [Clostridia bacterium]|nr:dockerin type I repeat-containing protein [Clostridia bacterium]
MLTAVFEGGETPEPLPGDFDGDGEVTIADALLTMRSSMGLIGLTDQQFAAANVDGDAEITIADALMIMRASMGLLEL